MHREDFLVWTIKKIIAHKIALPIPIKILPWKSPPRNPSGIKMAATVANLFSQNCLLKELE